MKRDSLNDQHLDLVEQQRLYFKTVKEFKEVSLKTVSQIRRGVSNKERDSKRSQFMV